MNFYIKFTALYFEKLKKCTKLQVLNPFKSLKGDEQLGEANDLGIYRLF